MNDKQILLDVMMFDEEVRLDMFLAQGNRYPNKIEVTLTAGKLLYGLLAVHIYHFNSVLTCWSDGLPKVYWWSSTRLLQTFQDSGPPHHLIPLNFLPHVKCLKKPGTAPPADIGKTIRPMGQN
ncbi:uncharacterized protein EDB91DRAFT_1077247 [Suillus paluster]|uniref:uncharacterized protein n=1 Tax=Suillus paluster TaxID=48578 RepID=UPI001B862C05|nr:uncharacterized protein EDB91DRAFT_1077247 [Suillus paluster]KAG1755273.1 hypothetical protein EDB91DRAFT_1077247 [Suillus paluster]